MFQTWIHTHCLKQIHSTISIISDWFYSWNIKHTIWNEAHFPPYPLYLWLKHYETPSTIFAEFTSETYTHCLTFEHTGHIGHAGYFAQCPLCCWSSLLIGYIMVRMEGWVEFHELLLGTVTQVLSTGHPNSFAVEDLAKHSLVTGLEPSSLMSWST